VLVLSPCGPMGKSTVAGKSSASRTLEAARARKQSAPTAKARANQPPPTCVRGGCARRRQQGQARPDGGVRAVAKAVHDRGPLAVEAMKTIAALCNDPGDAARRADTKESTLAGFVSSAPRGLGGKKHSRAGRRYRINKKAREATQRDPPPAALRIEREATQRARRDPRRAGCSHRRTAAIADNAADALRCPRRVGQPAWLYTTREGGDEQVREQVDAWGGGAGDARRNGQAAFVFVIKGVGKQSTASTGLLKWRALDSGARRGAVGAWEAKIFGCRTTSSTHGAITLTLTR